MKKKTNNSPEINRRRFVQTAALTSAAALGDLKAAAATTPDSTLSPAQQKLKEVWEEHMKCEFATKSVDDTMATMIEGGHVNHVPTMTGGQGLKDIRDFYTRFFIPQMPPDTKTTPISRTIGETQIVDKMIFEFTHTVPMDWMLPGISPTGQAGRGGTGGDHRIPGRQGFTRAHLLGPSLRAGSVGSAGREPSAGGRP